ncbi:MAG: 3-hydroxyisobutyryl-CoA hydrolase [Glaciihabitans sp.]|nr:3-hydroxyisobutyryl-CoA hydrolase [Glaciihabitans sp.]
MSEDTGTEVLFSRDRRVGHILLNRPRVMNALTLRMVDEIAAKLDEWAIDDTVETVVVSGAGDRGLCAGGDIVALYRQVLAGGEDAALFWAHEYALNAQIARYPKPYVALMDGTVFGGGVGVSAHGSVRVVTERTKIGMPEVGIGFVPDVGGTWLLSRAPGELGTHVGLTGGTFSAADAIELRLADFFVPSNRLGDLVEALASMPVSDALAGFATDVPASALAGARSWIDDCYGLEDAFEIVASLDASDVAEARYAADVIRSKSPTAVAVTLESLRRARALHTLEQVLDQEYRVSVRLAAGTEMVEGIRAQVIDKDRQPRWSPATLAGVARSAVEAYFAPVGRDELGLLSPTAR